MKRLLLPLLLILLPVWAMGANWYIIPDPANAGKVCYNASTWPESTACTGATANNTTIEACTDASADGDMVILSGGTSGYAYTGTQISGDSNLEIAKQIFLRGALSTDINGSLHSGRVTLDCNGAAVNCVRPVVHCATLGNCIVSGLKIGNVANSPVNYDFYNSGNNWIFNDLELYGGYRGLYAGSASNIWNRLYVHDTGTEAIWVASGGTFSYGKIVGAVTGVNVAGGSPVFNNYIISGTSSSAFFHNGSGTPELNNSFVLSAAYANAAEYPINNDGAAMTLRSNIITPNPASLTKLVTGSNITNTSPLYRLPQYRTGRRPAIVIFGVDDLGNLSYFETVAAKLVARGWRGTMAVTDPANMTASEQAKLISLHAAGHDLAAHAVAYSNLMTDTTGMRIQYVGAGSASAMTIASDTLTTTCTGDAGSNLSLDLTAAAYDTLTELCTYIDGLFGYTCTRLNADTSVSLPSTYLADVAGQDIRTATYDADFDATKVYDAEMTGCKTALETKIPGYTVSSWVCPGNASDATIQAALLARGFSASRGSGTTGEHTMASMSVYNITPVSLYSVFGNDANPQATAGKVEQYTAGMLEYLKFIGGVYFFFSHNTSEFSAAAWDALLSEVAKGGVQVMTLKQAGAYIVANGTDSGDHLTYTRTFTDASDYRLKAGSPAINKGTDVGLTTDYLGKPIRGVPDIGAYEFQQVGGGLGMGIIYGF